jgi:hypothetical protein
MAAGTIRAAGVLDTAIAPYVRQGWERVPTSIRNVLGLAPISSPHSIAFLLTPRSPRAFLSRAKSRETALQDS